MAQGTRNRWVRVATTGLGVLVCTGLVGCLNTDKDKKDKIAKQPAPTPGLYGTPSLPNGANAKALPPNPYGTTGLQQTGGFAQPADRTGTNTLKTSVPPQNFGGPSYNAPSTIGAPANPNPSFVPSPLPGQGNFQPTGAVNPPGGFTGYNTNSSPNPAAPVGRTATNSPPAPTLTDVGPIPPAPPTGFDNASFQTGAFPIAPPVPPVPPLASGANAFGPK